MTSKPPFKLLQPHLLCGRQAVARAASLAPDERRGPLEPVKDEFAGTRGLPEITVDELSAERLASGILHHGGLVVRRMLNPDRVARLRRHLEGEGPPSRSCMSPVAIYDVLSVYRDCSEVLGEYLGEAPVAMRQRTKIKRDAQQWGLRWHQDAPLFGGERRAVNFWTALTPVGVECPGLSLLPKRLESVLVADYDLTDLQDTRGDEAVRELSELAPPVSPVLDPGDTIVFDEMTLHETQRIGWEVPHREVAITWFFAPSRFPAEFGDRAAARCVPLALTI